MLGVSDLAPGLPEQRPGCGAKNVDHEMVDALEAMFGDVATTSRRIIFGTAEDPVEAMFDRGWSDGLPLVPPTPERVERMLGGISRDRADIVAVIPPNLVKASVEKVAINAVMAGCRPEYLPVVIAGSKRSAMTSSTCMACSPPPWEWARFSWSTARSATNSR